MVEKDIPSKIVVELRKLNDKWVQKQAHMLKMEEVFNQISTEITRTRKGP